MQLLPSHVDTAASFLGQRVEPATAENIIVNIEAVSSGVPNASWGLDVEAMGHRQADALRQMFDQVG